MSDSVLVQGYKYLVLSPRFLQGGGFPQLSQSSSKQSALTSVWKDL